MHRHIRLPLAILFASLVTLLMPAAAFAQGGISGTVTSSTTGSGIPGTVLQFYDLSRDDDAAATATTDVNGFYTVQLPAGSYGILTQNTQGYINEIWDNNPCSSVCDLGPTAITPVVVTNTVVTGRNFVLDPGFRISGRVTDLATGFGVAGVRVLITNADQALAFTMGVTDVNGDYITDGGTEAGNVFAFTENSLGYINRVWNDKVCQNCEPATIGDPIVVTNADIPGIDFALASGGKISGTVRDSSVPPLPLPGVLVFAFDQNGNSVGEPAITNGTGAYTIVGLDAGSYMAATDNPQGLVDKLFNNIACPNATCNKVNNGIPVGTLIPVVAGQDTAGKDFSLTAGGTITGTVTAAAGGAPIEDLFVGIFNVIQPNNQINFFGGASTNASGVFDVTLPAGQYFAAVLNQPGLQNQLFDHLPCTNCQINSGTPLNVTVGNTIPNVSFSLSPGGSIAGQVTDSGTGLGLSSNQFGQVQLLSSTGAALGSAFPNNSGFYSFEGLAVGSYYVRTVGVGSQYIHEVFPDVLCVNCGVTGTAGAALVPVTAGSFTDNIDFALTQGGKITGKVLNAQTGLLQAGIPVQIFTSTGVSFGSFTTGNGTPNGGLLGVYLTSGLPAGNYFVKTAVAGATDFIDEVYNNIPCVPCTVGIGTPVTVAGTATTNLLDIVLARGASISGTVTSAGAPVSGVGVIVIDSTGSNVRNTSTDASGFYTIAGLPPGIYYVRTNPNAMTQNFVSQLYNGMPYLGAPTIGTPVTLAALAIQTGVNFALTTGGAFSGVVTDAGTGAGLPNVQLMVFSAEGKIVKFANSDTAGAYTITGLAPGTYYAAATNFTASSFYKDELYNDMPCLGCVSIGAVALPYLKLPCSPACDSGVTTGTPITITAGATQTGVNFALAGGAGVISGLVSDAVTGFPLANVQVSVFNAAGTLVKSTTSQANTGIYNLRGLAPGIYFARTIVSPYTPYYTDEALGDMPCAPCAITSSTPITVTAGNTTTADFPLSPGGSLSGVVTSTSTGNGLAGLTVRVFTSAGALVKSTTTGSTGSFEVHGLPAASYRAVVIDGVVYQSEIYDNKPCSTACAAASGSPIAVTAGTIRSDVNFSLTLLPTVGVSGTVTSSTPGGPLVGTRVDFYDVFNDSDSPVATATTDVDGFYAIQLPAGTYAIATQDTHGYVNKIWDNVTCSAVCNLNVITLVAVTNSVVAGKNFVLDPGFRISGKVTTGSPPQPVAGVRVLFTNGDQEVVFTIGVTDALGNYTTEGGTAAGTVYAFTENALGYINEVWNDKVCLHCDPATLGTPIVVTTADKTGIDFALAQGAQIKGTVTANGVPVAGVVVDIFDQFGNYIDTAVTDGTGQYTSAGLPNGSYRAVTRNPFSLVDQLYKSGGNVICLNGNCDYGVGTLIVLGATANNINFPLVAGGTITGTVTQAAGGAPIQDVFVGLFSSTNTFLGGGSTNALGVYNVVLPAGINYAAVLNQPGFQNQLFDHLPCVNNCQPNTGAQLNVTVGNTIGNVDFSLSPGGSLSGTVTNSAGGAGLNGIQVQLFSTAGTVVASTNTSPSGAYAFNVAPGSYYVRTNTLNTSFINQLYPNIVCINCAVTTTPGATLVPITAGNVTANINFSLTSGGRITGTVATEGGTSVSGAPVQIYTSAGVSLGSFSTGTGANGTTLGFYATSGLPDGNYLVRTAVSAATNLIDEVFDNIPCVPCTVGIGKRVTITGANNTGFISFVLASGAAITGTVTSGGAPVASMPVTVYDSSGTIVKTATTDASGNYTAAGLLPGNYFVRTNPNAATQNFVTQLFNGMAYAGAPTVGTPVTLAAGGTQTGVNFSLTTGGALSGVVTDASTAAGIPMAQVLVYSSDARVAKFTNTDTTGAFTVTGLAPGAYYASASPLVVSSFYKDELYDDVPCLGCATIGAAPLVNVKLPCSPGCDSGVTTATAITITAGGTRTGVNFALAGGAGVISGLVSDAASGLPLSNVQVLVFNGAGVLVKTTTAQGNSGIYNIRGLAPGTYFARTLVSPYTPYYTDEANGDMPCAPCAITSSAPITVTAGNTTTADFALSPGGSFSGRVTAAKTGVALAGIDVQVFNATGALVKTTTTGSIGTFGFDGLPAGTYYGVALGGATYDGEVFLKCTGACNPTSGTPIVVAAGTTKTGVDFALSLTPNVTSLSAEPKILRFAATKAGAGGELRFVTPAQTVSVSVAGPAPIWTASASEPWIELTNGGGTGSGQMTIGIINPNNILGGTTTAAANVTITAGGLSAVIAVTLNVDVFSTGDGIKAPPFGSFDAPRNNATGLGGAIPVGGWALDDIGVAKVQLWRNCVDAIDRPAGACFASVPNGPPDFVYIGDGAFLAGARPDVERENPALPRANRAGWGYLMSTNALPHVTAPVAPAGGQGDFTLSAYAIDIEGQYSLLGTSRISLDNDHAIVPFGALDTPTQGGLVTEPIFASFGWAMTQAGKCIRTDLASSYKVYIDGVSLPLTPGVNWFAGLFRGDIANAYPGLCNTNDPLAAYYIDVTGLGLSNGLHTTGWDVIDDQGNLAGIGSRFFNILIGSSLTGGTGGVVGSGFSRIPDGSDVGRSFSSAAPELKFRPTPLRVQRGSDDAPFTTATADANGRYHVRFAAGGRLALDLGGPVEAGYQVVGDDLRALPPGSSLDAASGRFAWMPAVPFFGPFELVFVSGRERVDVTATITDPTATSEGIALHVDAPTADATVRGSFVVAGWALDPEAATGSGIDTLHVWAYRRDGVAEPQFLGAAGVGGLRPDVAAIYGEQFSAAGFTLTTNALPAGVYDILVYPHRANGTFGDAETVRVTVR